MLAATQAGICWVQKTGCSIFLVAVVGRVGGGAGVGSEIGRLFAFLQLLLLVL